MKRGSGRVANVLLNSASLWDRGCWQQAVKPDCYMDCWSGEGEIRVWDEVLASQPFPVMVPAEVETILCISQTS